MTHVLLSKAADFAALPSCPAARPSRLAPTHAWLRCGQTHAFCCACVCCCPQHAAPFSLLCVEDHVPLWPNGERVTAEHSGSGSPKSPAKVLSWGMLTAMSAPLRQFLESENVRLEVAWQLSEEWGVTTVSSRGRPGGGYKDTACQSGGGNAPEMFLCRV